MAIQFKQPTSTELFAASMATAMELEDVRVVGSFGRSVLHGIYDGNPTAEYEARGEDPLYGHNGQPRDIDIISTHQSKSIENPGPHKLDNTGFTSPYQTIARVNGEWILASDWLNFHEPLDPEVMQPISGETVSGIPVTTLPFQTQVALHALLSLRPKDVKTMAKLRELGERHGLDSQIDPGLYQPFNRLQALNQESSFMRWRVRYHNLLPQHIRTAIHLRDRLPAKLVPALKKLR